MIAALISLLLCMNITLKYLNPIKRNFRLVKIDYTFRNGEVNASALTHTVTRVEEHVHLVLGAGDDLPFVRIHTAGVHG